jgi:anoctamin-10/anoctamin-7
MANSGGVDIGVVLGLLGLLGIIFVFVYFISRWYVAMLSWKQDAAKQRRWRNDQDDFYTKNGYNWDCVMVAEVFKASENLTDEQRQYSLKVILHLLERGGLQVRMFYSKLHTKVFIKIRASAERLCAEADRINYKLQLDEKLLQRKCLQGNEPKWYRFKTPFPAGSKSKVEEGMNESLKKKIQYTIETKRFPYENMYIDYNDREDLLPLFQKHGEGAGGIFRGVDRLKLILSIMNSQAQECCGLDVGWLLQEKCLMDFFCMHNHKDVGIANKAAVTLLSLPTAFPVDSMKDYFGEKIGLYFLFTSHYTAWLLPAALLGIIFWAVYLANDNSSDSLALPYFSSLVSLWTVSLLEYWKRKEVKYALQWGMTGFEDNESARPQFFGELAPSPVDGSNQKYFSPHKRWKKVVRSYLIIFGLICGIILSDGAIFAFRRWVLLDWIISGAAVATPIAAVLVAIQIEIFAKAFGEIGLRLNDAENHRTDTEYEDALITKTFTFRFFNSYTALFYISFVKPFIQTIDPCDADGNCITEVQVFLAAIFICRMTLSNFVELSVPLYKSLKATWHYNMAKFSGRTYVNKKAVDEQQLFNLRRQSLTLNKDKNSSKTPSKDVELVPLGASKERNRNNRDTMSPSAQFLKLTGVSMEQNNPLLTGRQAPTQDSQEERRSELSHEIFGVSEVEVMSRLEEYHPLLGLFDDYSELAIQFGYACMFVAAFPPVLLLAFAGNYLELRLDAWKLTQLCKRPLPRSAEDIGSWQVIFEVIATCAVLTNAGMICYTSSQLIEETWTSRAWIFLGISCLLLGAQQVVALLVPDRPVSIEYQEARAELIYSKVVENKRDYEVIGKGHSVSVTPIYSILGFDEDPL